MGAFDREGGRPSKLSTGVYLLAFVSTVLIPVLLFAGLLIVRQANEGRADYELNAVQNARQVSVIVDGELSAFMFLLRGLETSITLANEEFERFYDQAQRVVTGRDETIVLRDLGSRQIVNTSRPFGDPLPPAVPLSFPEVERFRSGHWAVSNVYLSPTGGDPRIAVALPIMRDGEPRYLLAITLPTTRIRDALAPAVAPGWIITIGDRNGTIVTRSSEHDRFSGKSGRDEYLAKAVGQSGTFRTTGFDGRLLLTGYYRSAPHGWLFGANIPESIVAAPMRESLGWLIVAGATALAISCLLAYLLGSTFIKASTGLAERAAALGEGRPVGPMSSRFTEFALVGEALAAAGVAIERRDQQRQLLINELDHRVKNTLAMVQAIVQQTLRLQGNCADATEAVTRRLVALARVHDVLTRESWAGASLHELVRDISATQGDSVSRIIAEGPSVWLSSGLALSLSLALNELATNAIKYGALSNDRGVVNIDWSVADQGVGQKLLLRWAEQGGPVVRPLTREGFGMRMLRRSLARSLGGEVYMDFRPEGLVCTIEASISETAGPAPAENRTARPV